MILMALCKLKTKSSQSAGVDSAPMEDLRLRTSCLHAARILAAL